MPLSDDLALFPDNTTGAISASDLRAGLQSIYDSLDDADDAVGAWQAYANSAASTAASTAVSSHSSATTSVHGIADTSTLYRSGGTDVAIADGGTGASNAADAFTALKQAATETATGVVELATTTEAKAGTDTTRAITAAGSRAAHGYTLFDHYATVGNVGTGEDDLYSDTLPAGLFANNGDKVRAFYAGAWVNHASNTRQIRIYFGGTMIIDSTAYVTNSGAQVWTAQVELIRESSSVVRAATVLSLPPYTALGPLPILFSNGADVTGLTLANTQILKVTGEATSNDDVTARQGYAQFIPAA